MFRFEVFSGLPSSTLINWKMHLSKRWEINDEDNCPKALGEKRYHASSKNLDKWKEIFQLVLKDTI